MKEEDKIELPIEQTDGLDKQIINVSIQLDNQSTIHLIKDVPHELDKLTQMDFFEREEEYKKQIANLKQKLDYVSQVSDTTLQTQLTQEESETRKCQLQQELETLQEQVIKLRQENQEAVEKNNQLDQQIKQLVEEVARKDASLKDEEAQSSEKIKKLELESQIKSNEIGQLNCEVQNIKAQQGNASEGKKMVNISVEELIKWDKRSKDLTMQVKSLQMEVERIKLELEQKEKDVANQGKGFQNEIVRIKTELEQKDKLLNSKDQRNNLSMEGLEERCKALQNILNSTSTQNEQLTNENISFKNQVSHLKEDLKSCQEELKQLRETAKLKFRLQTELSQALSELDELKSQNRQTSDEKVVVSSAKQELINLQQIYQQCEATKNKYKQSYEEAYCELQNVAEERDSYRQQKEQQASKVKEFERMLSSYLNDYHKLDEKNQQLQEQVNQSVLQQKVIQQKHDLEKEKLLLEAQKSDEYYKSIEELNGRLQRDLQAFRENAFRRPSQSGEEKSNKKEKVILESLSNKVEQLENENKYLKNLGKEKIEELEMKLTNKKAFIIHIINILTKSHPSLADEVNNLDSLDIDGIKKMASHSYSQLQELIEVLCMKLMIENLHLREQITVLGVEINNKNKQ